MSTKRHRRIRTEPVPGADPRPQAFPADRDVEVEVAAEDRLGAWGDDHGLDVLPESASSSNNDRLEQDRPPHYA